MEGQTKSEEPIPSTLPTEALSKLLPGLINVLNATENPSAPTRVLQNQALAAATNELKDLMARAKNLIAELPGGEMLLEDQDAAIQSLEELRGTKMRFLSRFSQSPEPPTA